MRCKLQLIDLIRVFAAFLVGRQTILVSFFSRECRNRKETNGWKNISATGCYRYTSHVLSLKSFAQYLRMQLMNDFFYLYLTSDGHVNTIISRSSCVIIWCPEYWKWHFRASRFLNFLGEHAPRPPRLRGLTAPWSCHRLLFFNQLPTSNFIETPEHDVYALFGNRNACLHKLTLLQGQNFQR